MPHNEDRSVSDVLRDILENLQDIVRSEVRLAKAEFKTETGHAAKAAIPLIVGAVLSLYAGALLLLALVFSLSLVFPLWMATLTVGALVALLAAGLIGVGRTRLRSVNPKLEKTTKIMKEDVRWVKDQTR